MEQSIERPAWTSKFLDGHNVRVRKVKKLSKDCYLVKIERKVKERNG